jgi:D-sedoheptulose 7-phosphate isomerase
MKETTRIPEVVALDLPAIVACRFEQSIAMPEAFFARESEKIAEACWAMARRFHQGGRLFALGNGAWATDAQHVAVEFVHPVIVGKRALPALALTNDSATLAGLMARGEMMPFTHQLRTLTFPQDIVMAFSPDGRCSDIVTALAEAKSMGLLTLALLGEDGDMTKESGCDFSFVIKSCDPLVLQETYETLYHVLWELVHVFFEHDGLFI